MFAAPTHWDVKEVSCEILAEIGLNICRTSLCYVPTVLLTEEFYGLSA
jgi:hypothetical protein